MLTMNSRLAESKNLLRHGAFAIILYSYFSGNIFHNANLVVEMTSGAVLEKQNSVIKNFLPIADLKEKQK